ncbi:checkpoint clamp complex protein Rad1 [Vanrija albida]|uniref:Checkpoint clamp complex protein Rad1 n=1 Tax=Vanrija albida TaxID=181172 RepID=A0ABR3Q8M1_9TREE
MASERDKVPVLVAETDDVRPFARLLRGIGLKHHASMTISGAGFEVTVEEARSMSATAWVPANLFTEFTFGDDEPACFEISLDALLQSLNIFGNAGGGAGVVPSVGGGSKKRRWAGEGEERDDEDGWRARGRERRTGMRLTWLGTGYPLSILLRDDAKGPVTNCELFTLEPDELVNQAFDEANRSVYLIMKSAWFRDALLDLPPSCQRVTFRARPQGETVADSRTTSVRARKLAESGSFSIFAEGDFGTVQFDYPYDAEVMDAFECEEAVTFSYHASHVALLGRAVQHSAKICLQIETTGFLSVQVMMPLSENQPPELNNGILDFKMNALDEEEEDE